MIVLINGIMVYSQLEICQGQGTPQRAGVPWMGRVTHVLCGNVLSLLTDHNQFEGYYDTLLTGKVIAQATC